MKKGLLFLLLVSTLILTSCKQTNNEEDPQENIIDFEQVYPEHGTYYQIFVRSFADSDNDGIGDFNGITEKLDYLVDLGVDGIWLMPIHPSPSYHGYDVLDYYAVNEDYGTMADFENLLDMSEEKGINVIIDYVINHTSNQHPWFQGWLNGEEEYLGFYRDITSSDDRFEENRSIWHAFDSGQYYAGYFGSSMPDLNWSNTTVQNKMIDIAKYWLEKGVDGFRLDATIHLEGVGEVKAPTIPIESTLTKLEYFEFKIEEDYPNTFIVGEVWDAFSTSSKFYQAIDATFNFETGDDITRAINAGFSNDYITSISRQLNIINEYEDKAIYAPFLYNHDQDRIASIMNDRSKLKLAAGMLLTLPGNPFIYYGEELGMKGVKTYGPDIWDETRRLPLPFGDDYTTTWFEDTYNQNLDDVTTQLDDPNSLLNVYKTLLNLRQTNLSLKYGKFIPYEEASNVLLGYYRVFNYDDTHQSITLVLHNVSDGDYQLYLDNYDVLYYSKGNASFTNTLEAKSTVIFELPIEKIGELDEE
ncbi:MAG: alpha-amylase [Candidatus Izimaplasma sp.]|nr:alpha-amylase [Candidatus Izimaplasma bacterium]